MDKKEYNLKLEEIDKYVNQGNYSEAARVADSIDWRRVRNVRTLCMVSEIYEADNRYEDSKELLLRAYRRSPMGRTILYRLVEVTIQLKQFDEAIEFYAEYVQSAPNDNSRYILKYKIYRGRGSSLEEQIDILKEYLDQEYTEKWAYELAKLYQQAGKTQECLAACDDLVLWFHSGKYVIKALELKKRYAPLTPKQQEIYDRRFDLQEEDDIYADEEELGREKQIVETGSDDSLAENILADTEKEIAKTVAEAADQTAQEEASAEEEQKTPSEAPTPEETSGEDVPEEEEEPEDPEEARQEDEGRQEPETDQTEERRPRKDLHSDLIKSMREIVSGVRHRVQPDPEEEMADQVIEQSKEEQEAAQASREKEISIKIPKMDIEDKSRENIASKLSIDDILLSMGEKGDAIRQAAAKASRENQNPNTPAGVISAMDEALMNMGVNVHGQKEEEQPARQEEAPEEAPQTTQEIQEPAKPMETEPEEKAPEMTEEDIISAKTRRIPTDEIAEIHASFGLEPEEEEEFLDEEESFQEEEEPVRAEDIPEPEDERAEEPRQEAEAETVKAPEEQVQERPVRQRQQKPSVSGRSQEASVPERRSTRSQKVQEMPRRRRYPGPMLKEYQKGLFAGFLDIQNLESQIASAIALAEQKGEDRTSRTGNILIFGDHGCGKTTIGVGIAKAIAQDRGIQFVKMAKIYAADLNRKDIASTIAKIAGGVLIVEEAGDLEDAIVDQLTTAMEFRTDGLIIILEDEQRYLHDLLMRHPRFTMKFTSQIFIPTFTIDELVRFGEIYAGQHDYVFSQGAASALYDRIGSVSAQGDAVSITNVIELVDRAVRKANKFFRKMSSGKKRYDENDCVILQEKDFR